MNRLQLKPLLLKTALLTGFALLMGATSIAQPALEFDNIWIAEAPPGSQVMAAYMDIKNTGSKTLKIVPPQSDDFKKIEFHHTFHENGLARMQHQPELLIPAQSTISLEPGSYHMMLFNPVRKLKAGDDSAFYFQIKDGHKDSRKIKVVAHVKKPVFGQTDEQADKQSDHNHH